MNFIDSMKIIKWTVYCVSIIRGSYLLGRNNDNCLPKDRQIYGFARTYTGLSLYNLCQYITKYNDLPKH